MEDKRILFVGLICVDIVNVVKEFPKEDSDHRTAEQRWHTGGNAANSSTVLSLLGVPCECMGTVSVSPELNFITDTFKSRGIKANLIYHEGHTCPLSIVILNSQTGSRTILHGNKSLPEVTLDDFKKINLSNYNWIHFEGRPTAAEIAKMLQHVDKYNQTVPDEKITTSVELEKFLPQMETLADKADVVYVSKDYACASGFKNKEEACKTFHNRCRPGATVVCAWGEDGAAATSADGITVSCPVYPPEKVVDTLGAGDTFNAVSILAQSRGKSVGDAIKLGCKVAGAKCGMHGYDGLTELFGNQNLFH